MPSVLKAATEVQKRKDKGKGKSTASASENGNGKAVDEDTPKVKPRKDKNLLISSRGVTQRMRHLMNDLEALLPHTKKGKSCLASLEKVED
jgi:ribosome biogenesis protein BRX1